MHHTGQTKQKWPPWYKLLFGISAGLFICAGALTLYGILTGNLLGDSSFGPGAYYYTDVPNFKARFLEGPVVPIRMPLLTGGFFVLWSLFIYRIWVFLDKKL